MSQAAQNPPQRVTLAGFLDKLGNEDASQAKAAAEAIDELERQAYPVRGIEQQLMPLFGITGVAFVLGLIVFILGALGTLSSLSGFYRLATPLLLGALPTLAVYYAFRVRKRSRADARSFDLNQKHFIPHGGIYFPPPGPGEPAWVVLIDQSQGWKPKPSKYDHIKPGGPIW